MNTRHNVEKIAKKKPLKKDKTNTRKDRAIKREQKNQWFLYTEDNDIG